MLKGKEDLLFYYIDDFCKIYEEWKEKKLLPTTGQRNREGKLSLSEKLFIMIGFHLSPYKEFKYYYLHGICQTNRFWFQSLPSYGRFVQLMPSLFVPLTLLLHLLKGEKTGLYFVDSTTLPVCHVMRNKRNRLFSLMAAKSKSTMGWFFGLKLHLVINHKADIVALQITPGNFDDRSVLERLFQSLKGSVYADKGYISKEKFLSFFKKGLKLITNVKRNMRNCLMSLFDKLMLRKRFLIETVFSTLKQNMNLQHTRHRSTKNYFINLLSCLVAYSMTKNQGYKKIAYP
jgi:hypothetical protein